MNRYVFDEKSDSSESQVSGVDQAGAIQQDGLRESLIRALSRPKGQRKSKDTIRSLHETQRSERARAEERMLREHSRHILPYFAEGPDIDPARIAPRLVPITKSHSIEGFVFRAATLLWSVPVSKGYGRRMRYLVVDQYNSKLLGIIALGDPVFNLKCRDDWIGWDVDCRRERLAFLFDAYVLGAVPPYSFLLGAKLVGSLLAAREIRDDFRARYASSEGVISHVCKDPHLVMLTTTSALGRSSIYNRLRLPGVINFQQIGYTNGWGHFTVPDELFSQLRVFLRAQGDPYADNYRFGQGPSWRLRALRKACVLLKVDDSLLRHGVQREVFAIPLVVDWREVLLGRQQVPASDLTPRSAAEIGELAIRRWVIPRSERNMEWRCWSLQDTWSALTQAF